MTYTTILSNFPLFIILITLLAVLSALVAHKLINLLRLGNQKNETLPPGPKSLPIIGCLHYIVGNKPAFRWMHSIMEKMNTQIACFRLGRVHVITVTSPEVGQELLLKQDNIFCSRPIYMSTQIPSYGYLTVALTPYGDQWKKMRRVLTNEVFSTQKHSWLQGKRMEEISHLTRWVYNLCNNDSTNTTGMVKVRTVAQHYCGNVLRKLMINKRFFGKGMVDGGPGLEEIEHVDSLFKILGYINEFSVSDYLPCLRRFDLDGHEKILQNALENIKKYQDPVIDERIYMWRVTKEKKEVEDILDVLIQLTDDSSTGSPLLTSSEIKAQILELMFTGVDNPSHATEWALAEMINQPKLLQKAVEELDQVVGKDRLVQESDLPKLNYIKACIREAFRLHPVMAFNVPHASTADTNVAGYFIPKGSHVFISRIGLGRNPNIWEEPLKFNPERHINPDGSQVVLTDPKLGLLSFSTGRRGCPAVVLGSTMTNMLLATLVHGFTWATPLPMVSISLAEAEHDITLSKPLVALAKPRLAKNVYLTGWWLQPTRVFLFSMSSMTDNCNLCLECYKDTNCFTLLSMNPHNGALILSLVDEAKP